MTTAAKAPAPSVHRHITPPSMTPPPMTPPPPSPGLRVRLSPAGPALWRVIDMAGRIIGHLQHVEHVLGPRWAARRYRDGAAGFRTLGEFWSIDEAVSALRGA